MKLDSVIYLKLPTSALKISRRFFVIFVEWFGVHVLIVVVVWLRFIELRLHETPVTSMNLNYTLVGPFTALISQSNLNIRTSICFGSSRLRTLY